MKKVNQAKFSIFIRLCIQYIRTAQPFNFTLTQGKRTYPRLTPPSRGSIPDTSSPWHSSGELQILLEKLMEIWRNPVTAGLPLKEQGRGARAFWSAARGKEKKGKSAGETDKSRAIVMKCRICPGKFTATYGWRKLAIPRVARRYFPLEEFFFKKSDLIY